jgi:TRAP-type mannitol/chloroaromatic compound transport system substrate-binding protein
MPAVAQSQPTVRWRMSTAWPKSLDTLFGSADELCKRVSALTDGKFEIRCFPGGEIVPVPQNMDAVSNGTVECNHLLATFHIGKNTALAFDAGLSFGLNARQHNAWVHYGGGMDLLRKLYGKYGITNFVCGNVGVQMGGWYRKEIKSVADIKGLKMRIGGIGGMVLSKLGGVPQQIAPGEVYSALEKGTLDATEFVGPYDDQKLGFNKVAPFYYSPGWFEGSASITTMVNQKAFEALPASYKAAFEAACNEQTMKMIAHYDAANPAALRKLIAAGTQLRYFPRDVMDATRLRRNSGSSCLRKTPTSKRSTPRGASSSRIRRAGSGSPKARWTTIRSTPSPAADRSILAVAGDSFWGDWLARRLGPASSETGCGARFEH